jgi:hypothetical protein
LKKNRYIETAFCILKYCFRSFWSRRDDSFPFQTCDASHVFLSPCTPPNQETKQHDDDDGQVLCRRHRPDGCCCFSPFFFWRVVTFASMMTMILLSFQPYKPSSSHNNRHPQGTIIGTLSSMGRCLFPFLIFHERRRNPDRLYRRDHHHHRRPPLCLAFRKCFDG